MCIAVQQDCASHGRVEQQGLWHCRLSEAPEWGCLWHPVQAAGLEKGCGADKLIALHRGSPAGG